MLQSQEYVGLLIGAARRRLRQAVTAQSRRYGLSAQEFWILIAAREVPEGSLGELAERQKLELPTASRVIASLAKRGLVKATFDEQDRRRARISLTAKGQKLSAELQRVAQEVRRVVSQGMSAGEEEALRSGLRKVMSNLDRYLAGLGDA